MIFYGEASRVEPAGALIERIASGLGVSSRAGGQAVERHAALVGALIDAGQLRQGLADRGDASEGETAVAHLTQALARQVIASWTAGFIPSPDEAAADLTDRLQRLAAADLPTGVTVKPPEGFLHYAVYPEAYALAARRSGLRAQAKVVGIRSIGTTLAAVAAAALGADVPSTVRPTGHPFRRMVRFAPPGPPISAGTDWLIVDEGPGLSGSSFAAVAETLIENGAAPSRITFLPSHAGEPGAEADGAIRRRWAATHRVVADTDPVLRSPPSPARPIEDWVGDLAGGATGPAEDLSAGAWRARRCGPEIALWPPADGQNERRKFLVRGSRADLFLKFAGLGDAGQQAYRRAERLAAAGFVLPPLALRYGFLVEPWRDDLRPLRLDGPGERAAFLAHLVRYLAFRATALPAGRHTGATLTQLLTMAETNTREALGAEAAARLGRWRPVSPAWDAALRRVETDNRLQTWEWLVGPGDRWFKTDGIDHCAGHDLVGCQDIAWDVAGATVEFSLSRRETRSFLTALERATGEPLNRGLFDFYRVAYAAFQLGAWTLALSRTPPIERRAVTAEIERYGRALSRSLDETIDR